MSGNERQERAMHIHDVMRKKMRAALSSTHAVDQTFLFFINAASGQLEQHDFGRPAMGLPVGPPVMEGCDHQVEKIATYIFGEIRSIQPRGPYALAGYCFGGIVALEVARLLTEAGEAVEQLYLVETPHLAWVERLELIRCLLQALTRPGLSLRKLRRSVAAQPALTNSRAEAQIKESYYRAIRQACNQFSIRPYPGPVTLISGTRSRNRFFATAGWRSTARAVEVVRVRGCHGLPELLLAGQLCAFIRSHNQRCSISPAHRSAPGP